MEERKQVLSAMDGTKITRVKISDDGSSVEVYFTELQESAKTNDTQTETEKTNGAQAEFDSESLQKGSQGWLDYYFPVVDPRNISDEVKKYEPRTRRQVIFKHLMLEGVGLGRVFRTSIMDPSFSEDGKGIQYKAGEMPAVGKTAIWNENAAKNFLPSKNSCLIKDTNYAVFLGTLIQYLVGERGYTMEEAWYAVCDDSTELGHFYNSPNAKHTFETTGSRRINWRYDFGNTYKIAKTFDGTSFVIFGGNCNCNGYTYPLADLSMFINQNLNCNNSVVQIELDV